MKGKWVKCGAMPNRKFRVKRPVSVFVYRADGEYLAVTYWLNDWGTGDSASEAMLGLMWSLTDKLEIFEGQRLGRYLQKIQARIKTYIGPAD